VVKIPYKLLERPTFVQLAVQLDLRQESGHLKKNYTDFFFLNVAANWAGET
jgi:hypothetical protein